MNERNTAATMEFVSTEVSPALDKTIKAEIAEGTPVIATEDRKGFKALNTHTL